MILAVAITGLSGVTPHQGWAPVVQVLVPYQFLPLSFVG